MERKKSLLNPIILMLTTLVALCGIIFGVIYAEKSPEAQNALREAGLFSDNFKGVLGKSLQINLLWTTLYFLSGLSVFFIPVTAAALFTKNYSFGFTAGCLIATMGLNGYMTALSGVILHNFIFALFSVFYSAYGINKSFECFLNRRNYDYRIRKNKRFAIVSIVAVIINIAVSFSEAYISALLYEI